MVNSNQGGEGKALLQFMSQNPNVQMEYSESGTILLKYGREVILETNLQIPQLYKSVSAGNSSPSVTPESNPQPKPKTNKLENKLLKVPIESPNNKLYAIIPASEWDKRSKETHHYNNDATKHSSQPEYSASSLLDLLIEYCDGEEEVKHCCFHLIREEPKYDEIINEKSKSAIARRLMELLNRRKKLGELVNYLKKTYPHIIIEN